MGRECGGGKRDSHVLFQNSIFVRPTRTRIGRATGSSWSNRALKIHRLSKTKAIAHTGNNSGPVNRRSLNFAITLLDNLGRNTNDIKSEAYEWFCAIHRFKAS